MKSEIQIRKGMCVFFAKKAGVIEMKIIILKEAAKQNKLMVQISAKICYRK